MSKMLKSQVLTSLLLLAVVVEALSVVEWGIYPYFPDKGLVFARTDAAVFAVLAPFSPTFLILLLYTWPGKLAISLDNQFSKGLKAYLNWLARPLLQLRAKITSNSELGFALASRPRLLLLLAAVVAVLLGLVPYRPDLNPSMTPIGVDAHFYVDSVNHMLQRTPAEAVSYAMGTVWEGSRPLLLVPMYLAAATGLVSVNQTYETLPVIFGPLLAVSTFVFVREGYHDERVAGVASLFSVLSFNTTVGMWAGFYANWLALAEAYLFLAILLGFLRAGSGSKFIILTLLSLAMLLTHPWTWFLVLAVTTVFVLAVWRHDQKFAFVRALIVLLIINIALDVAKSVVFGARVSVQDVAGSVSGSGLSQSFGFWPNLIGGLFTAYNGLLGNAILLGLPIITMLFLGFRDNFERLLTLWVALGSIPFLVATSLLQTRILYDMPLPVLSAVAVICIIRPMGNKPAHSNLGLLLVFLLSANYALRSITNLVAVPF
jgi:hypothetical protein